MTDRGTIHHENRAKQLIRFDGCNIEGTNITPTDIDGYIEYHNKSTIMIEVKTPGKEVEQGQRLVLERFVHDGYKAGKRNLAIVADHHSNDPSDDIFLRDCTVRNICTYDENNNFVYRNPNIPDLSVYDCINKWVNWIDSIALNK